MAKEELTTPSLTGDAGVEEEVEPLLKYNRLANDLKKVLKEIPASCLAVHPKFLAIGSHEGTIHIFDHEGNCVTDKLFTSHTATVNQICVDAEGEYIASCADDGKTVINGLYSHEHEQVIEFDRPVKAVAINPQYSRHAKQFVTGDDKLIISTKTMGLFGKSLKRTCLHQGEGLINCIKWSSTFIAWANTLGVKVYDTTSQQRITSIKFSFPPEAKQRPDLYKCSMCWRDESTLLIGYGNEVRVCEIKTRYTPDARDLPSKYAQITAMFKTDYFIAGIGPASDGNLVLLSYSESEVKVEGKRIVNPRPHVRLVQPCMDYCVEKSNDALDVRNYEMYGCNLYALEWVPGENCFFVVSPKDVIAAKPRTEEDHINWLVERNKFEEAMAVVQKSQQVLNNHTYDKIGFMYLDHLCELGKFEEAARKSVSILGTNKQAWELYFYKFRDNGAVKEIARYLPCENPMLSQTVYELVLYDILHSSVHGFKHLVESWDSSLYDAQTIVNAVLEYIKTSDDITEEDNRLLYESLALLYTSQANYSEALSVYLRLKHDDVFPFIRKHNLFSSISTQIVLLMEFNTELALELLLGNMECIPPQKVVPQLAKHKRFQFLYLDQLFKKMPDECSTYHNTMVFLYAEHSPKELLAFLKKADGYDQSAAVKFCEQRELTKEKVYLLGKMGNHRQALQLIVTQLQDVEYAIDFCKEHNYESLWNELINYSLEKPKFIKALLDNIGTHVDPLILIQHIPDSIEIPNLRNSLVKILQDYNLQISLREDCQKILAADNLNLLAQHIKLQRKGFYIEDSAKCAICHGKVIASDLRCSADITVFYCHHVFHMDCLPVTCSETCAICNAQKRSPGLSS
ncbi:vacuolar protein sorting-associated protein 41 homolog [Watersipora subatra]|uniref:vacuolar protein sorting-associated protein 41 homolog n=1 Tax=Watersipora subatra TaxID=2589382 RepID=UPI00355AD1DF